MRLGPPAGDRASSSAIACSAAAQATGLPPKVPPTPPGAIASMIVARPTTAASGRPPAIDFAQVIRSGRRSSRSDANIVPVRPKPVCTSSAISTTPKRSQKARSSATKAGGGTTNPPSPSTGSMITAARSWGRTSVRSASSSGRRGPCAAIGVGEGQPVDVGGVRAEAGLVGQRLAGQGQRQQRAAVEAVLEAEHRAAPGVAARDLDRVLHRLGAGGQQQGALVERARHQAAQRLRDGDVAFVADDLKAGVGAACRLAAGSRRPPRRARARRSSRRCRR